MSSLSLRAERTKRMALAKKKKGEPTAAAKRKLAKKTVAVAAEEAPAAVADPIEGPAVEAPDCAATVKRLGTLIAALKKKKKKKKKKKPKDGAEPAEEDDDEEEAVVAELRRVRETALQWRACLETQLARLAQLAPSAVATNGHEKKHEKKPGPKPKVGGPAKPRKKKDVVMPPKEPMYAGSLRVRLLLLGGTPRGPRAPLPAKILATSRFASLAAEATSRARDVAAAQAAIAAAEKAAAERSASERCFDAGCEATTTGLWQWAERRVFGSRTTEDKLNGLFVNQPEEEEGRRVMDAVMHDDESCSSGGGDSDHAYFPYDDSEEDSDEDDNEQSLSQLLVAALVPPDGDEGPPATKRRRQDSDAEDDDFRRRRREESNIHAPLNDGSVREACAAAGFLDDDEEPCEQPADSQIERRRARLAARLRRTDRRCRRQTAAVARLVVIAEESKRDATADASLERRWNQLKKRQAEMLKKKKAEARAQRKDFLPW